MYIGRWTSDIRSRKRRRRGGYIYDGHGRWMRRRRTIYDTFEAGARARNMIYTLRPSPSLFNIISSSSTLHYTRVLTIYIFDVSLCCFCGMYKAGDEQLYGTIYMQYRDECGKVV